MNKEHLIESQRPLSVFGNHRFRDTRKRGNKDDSENKNPTNEKENQDKSDDQG